MEPVLGSLAGLDSAVAAAAINAITAFSERFSGPVFSWAVISLSSFLVLHWYVSKRIHTFVLMSNRSQDAVIYAVKSNNGLQQYANEYMNT